MDEKRALVCVAGPEKTRITATIGFASDGTFITPEFNLKSQGEDGSMASAKSILKPLMERYGKKIGLALSRKAWASTTTVKAYITREIFPLARRHGHVILYLDAFSGHFYNNSTKEYDVEFIQYCLANRVFIRYLPGGTTPFLQVGDTHHHRFIKAYIAKRWAVINLNKLEKAVAERTLTADGLSPEVATHLRDIEVREWVIGATLDALHAILPATIVRSFVENGLTGANSSEVKIASQLHNMK